jgi:hypothetical protein
MISTNGTTHLKRQTDKQTNNNTNRTYWQIYDYNYLMERHYLNRQTDRRTDKAISQTGHTGK